MNRNIIRKLNKIPLRKRQRYIISLPSKSTIINNVGWFIDNKPLDETELSYEDEQFIWKLRIVIL